MVTMNTVRGSCVDIVPRWITRVYVQHIDNSHGWSTCERNGFPLDRLPNQKPPYKIIWCTCGFMWRTSVKKNTFLHILSTCPRVTRWLTCAITMLCTRRDICYSNLHGFRSKLPCGHMAFHVLYM